MLTFTTPCGSSRPRAGCAKLCLGKGHWRTFATASWVFIPASQCHHHRHHLQKGVLGVGVPSCSDKTGKSSQSSPVPTPGGLPACGRSSEPTCSWLQVGKEVVGWDFTERTHPEASKPGFQIKLRQTGREGRQSFNTETR